MKDRLNAYIDGLFANAESRSPANGRLAELKEELLQNTQEKYDDLVAMGQTPEAACHAVINGIGDIDELLNDVIRDDTRSDGRDVGRNDAEKATNAVASSEAQNSQSGDVRDDGDRRDDIHELHENGEDGKADSARPPRSRWYALVSGIIWTVILCAYFAVSFATHAWSVTWLLFIMGIAADNVAQGIFDLRR